MYILKPYDDALSDVLNNGVLKHNRTGIDTYALFGYQMKFDISKRFPIVTKRKMFYKSIFKELLWMLSGSTNVNDLEAMGSKIWSLWKDSEFEKKNSYEDGQLGPIYGWQMRHFGGDFANRQAPDGVGFDQIDYIVNELKNNPTSRRILMSYWDPSVVTTSKCKLPPCHYSFQLDVTNGKLNGMLTQRSCDLFIGGPANIQFYSALIYMLAQQADLDPGAFVHSIADIHIYCNQIDGIKEYLKRDEVESPTLILNKKNINNYSIEDFNIINYNPLEPIKVPVAV